MELYKFAERKFNLDITSKTFSIQNPVEKTDLSEK